MFKSLVQWSRGLWASTETPQPDVSSLLNDTEDENDLDDQAAPANVSSTSSAPLAQPETFIEHLPPTPTPPPSPFPDSHIPMASAICQQESVQHDDLSDTLPLLTTLGPNGQAVEDNIITEVPSLNTTLLPLEQPLEQPLEEDEITEATPFPTAILPLEQPFEDDKNPAALSLPTTLIPIEQTLEEDKIPDAPPLSTTLLSLEQPLEEDKIPEAPPLPTTLLPLGQFPEGSQIPVAPPLPSTFLPHNDNQIPKAPPLPPTLFQHNDNQIPEAPPLPKDQQLPALQTSQIPKAPPPSSSIPIPPPLTKQPLVKARFGKQMIRTQSLTKKKNTKTVSWKKMDSPSMQGRKSVWSKSHGLSFSEDDFEKLESLYERQSPHHEKPESLTSPKFPINKRKETPPNLLCQKRAMNLGIILSMFRPMTPEQVVASISNGENHKSLTTENLHQLLGDFPTNDEIQLFRLYSDDGSQLKGVEQFVWLVSQQRNFELSVKLRVLKQEFEMKATQQHERIDQVLSATEVVQKSPPLDSFLHACLELGNHLNQGSYGGDALGFQLSSLLKLLDEKSNEPQIKFIHVLAEFAEKHNESILNFPDSVKQVADVVNSRINPQELSKEVITLRRDVQAAKEQLELCQDEHLTKQYSEFLKNALAECETLCEAITKMSSEEKTLKQFFCADGLTLEEILTIIHKAATMFVQALKMNHEKEERQERRRNSVRNSD